MSSKTSSGRSAQVEPILKFDLAALGGDTVEMWNDGFEAVIDVRVNPEIVALAGLVRRTLTSKVTCTLLHQVDEYRGAPVA